MSSTIDIKSTAVVDPEAPKAEESSGPPVEVQATEEAQGEERPGWLPEKFKSPEDFAEAYKSLEQKLGTPKPEVPKKSEEPTEAPVEGEKPTGISAFEAEYAEKGELSEESFTQLEGLGVSRQMVETYINGQKVLAEKAHAEVYSVVGGQEKFDSMAQWAATALPTEQSETLNEMFSEGGQKAKMAAQILQKEYVEANGANPKLLEGSPAVGGDTYRTYQEMMKDMADPRYKNDAVFRNSVTQKLSRSGDML